MFLKLLSNGCAICIYFCSTGRQFVHRSIVSYFSFSDKHGIQINSSVDRNVGIASLLTWQHICHCHFFFLSFSSSAAVGQSQNTTDSSKTSMTQLNWCVLSVCTIGLKIWIDLYTVHVMNVVGVCASKAINRPFSSIDTCTCSYEAFIYLFHCDIPGVYKWAQSFKMVITPC